MKQVKWLLKKIVENACTRRLKEGVDISNFNQISPSVQQQRDKMRRRYNQNTHVQLFRPRQ